MLNCMWQVLLIQRSSAVAQPMLSMLIVVKRKLTKMEKKNTTNVNIHQSTLAGTGCTTLKQQTDGLPRSF